MSTTPESYVDSISSVDQDEESEQLEAQLEYCRPLVRLLWATCTDPSRPMSIPNDWFVVEMSPKLLMMTCCQFPNELQLLEQEDNSTS